MHEAYFERKKKWRRSSQWGIILGVLFLLNQAVSHYFLFIRFPSLSLLLSCVGEGWLRSNRLYWCINLGFELLSECIKAILS